MKNEGELFPICEDFSFAPEDFQGKVVFRAVHVDAQYGCVGGDIELSGTITAQLELICARCLEPFIKDVICPLEERFSHEESDDALPISAADTIERMIDAFPASQQRQIRTQLSLVLQATVSQMLIPALDGTTIPVFEVMHMNTAIRNLIREEKTYQIDSVIASNGAVGMQTMDQALFNAVREGKVAKDVALQYSHHQEALLRRFQAEGL